MKKIIYQLALICIGLFLTSCDWNKTESLMLHNNTSDAIYHVTIGGKRDTIYNTLSNCYVNHIFPKEWQNIHSWKCGHGDGPDNFSNGADTLRIMIIREVYDYYWISDTANIYNVFLVRYDLSYNDIEKLKFKLTYPPTPEMKYIHMYPPYEEIMGR